MKRRLLTFITALFILLLASNCAGIKPFFQVDNSPVFAASGSKSMTQINMHSDSYSYIPSSAQEEGIFNQNKGRHKFSVSFPATAKFEF